MYMNSVICWNVIVLVQQCSKATKTNGGLICIKLYVHFRHVEYSVRKSCTYLTSTYKSKMFFVALKSEKISRLYCEDLR